MSEKNLNSWIPGASSQKNRGSDLYDQNLIVWIQDLLCLSFFLNLTSKKTREVANDPDSPNAAAPARSQHDGLQSCFARLGSSICFLAQKERLIKITSLQHVNNQD